MHRAADCRRVQVPVAVVAVLGRADPLAAVLSENRFARVVDLGGDHVEIHLLADVG